jgi:queuine tRNA-ribosyltransferase
VLTQRIDATDGLARATTITTARGTIRTPCFMPVGTRGTVRAAGVDDLAAVGAQVVLGNTYHLMLKPGADIVERLGGLHRFTGWDGHILTDSGGYQVFSLDPSAATGRKQHSGNVVVDDEGVTFRSTYDGSTHRLTPEDAVRVQEQLGADIQMQLDVCARLPATDRVLRLAVDRTLAWGERALEARRRTADQALFGIVQGGTDVDLRVEAAVKTAALGFDGYGIGGLSVGETRAEMVPAIEATTAALPVDRPRYGKGQGDAAGMVEAVARGVDLFDCVLPSRIARHASALTDGGRINLRNAKYGADESPLDEGCPCPVCARHSKAFLRHLFAVGEPTALRLTTVHNLAWTVRLVEEMRAAIEAGTFADLRSRVLSVWG